MNIFLKEFSEKLFLLIATLFITVPYVFADEGNDTTKHNPAEYLSNTLPVLYINTDDEEPITSRTNYVDGEYYLDANGCAGYESIGTDENPLPLEIKGRGNSTWHFPKKPYRLKLDTKMPLLGMPKSRHWILLSGYHEWLAGHGKNYLCMKISEKLGMPYTTRCVPCEVVLNGDYIGLYFLTEQIRVAKERVNITEQDDGETDPALITGGWLLELDNYNDKCQIRFRDIGTGKPMRVTYHSPEELSGEQKTYLTELINNVNESVNSTNYESRRWEEYIDIDALARFYVLLEVIDDQEGFSGSCWFSKERGENTKLVWGPYWDSGSALGNRNITGVPDFFYNDQENSKRNCWISNIVNFPRFQIACRKWWKKYRDEVFPTMQQEVDDFGLLTEQALACDYLRWGDESATNPERYRRNFMIALQNKRDFLISKWDVPAYEINWATYYSDVDLSLPQGVQAFLVNDVTGAYLDISPIDYIPAKVGVLLYGISEMEDFTPTPYCGMPQKVFSKLIGSIEPQTVADGFVMHDNRFVLAPAGTPIEPHRCYIPATSDYSTPTIVNIEPHITADVNCDGYITSYDVVAIYNYLLNGDETYINTSDVNGDGSITGADITAIYYIMLGN